MSFFSTLFNKIKKKEKVEVPITKLPSTPVQKSQPERNGNEVRLPAFEKAPHEIKEEKPWEAKKIPVWKPGDVILDLYEVEDIITSGGMGRIYVTNQRNWNVKVAIKSPTEEMLEDRSYFSRVQKEADAWTELGLHPNIAYCYFVRNIKDIPHLFVEYVDGGNLREWIMDGRCADLKVGLDLAIQFCHGMAYAHEKGMIHRDIKPENILMTKDGTLKVTDFGIARLGTKEDLSEKELGKWQDDTRTVGFIGTKAYASPEQWQDAHNVGEETDIFSFGVCLWEMLCGRRPYSIAVEKENIPDPRTLTPDLPESLYTLLEELVSFEKEKREELGDFETLRERFKSIYQERFNEPSPHSELEKLNLKADGLNNRAVSYLEVGREEDARSCWEETLKDDPQHLEATFNYGYLRWQKAEIPDDVYVTQLQELEGSKGTDPDYRRCLEWVDKARPVGRHLRTIWGRPSILFFSVCLSPDGQYALSGSGDNTLSLWEVESGRELRRFEGHTSVVTSVCFSPDGRHALSGSSDKTIRLWEVESGKELRRFEGHTSVVNSVCFSPDGRYALSGSQDETIRLWEVESGREIRRFEGHTSFVYSVCFSPDGRYVLSGDVDTTVRLWEVESGRALRRFKGHITSIHSVCFSPDGRYALSGSHMTLILWEICYPENGWMRNHPFPLISRVKSVTALGVERDRFRVLVKAAKDSIKKSSFHEAYRLLREGQSIPGYERDKDMRDLLTLCGLKGNGRRRGLKSAWLLHTLEGDTSWVYSVCFSPDGRYVLSGSSDKTLRLWEVENWKELRKFEGQTNSVMSVCFSPDGRYVLSGSYDKTIRLWEVETGKELRRFEGHTGPVTSVCFSPDGRYVLSGSWDETVRLWEVESGREIRQFEGHINWTNYICFSPDGRYALLGSYDGTLRLWEVESGREVRRFWGHTGPVTSVCFSPDGRYVLSGSNDKTLRLWEVESGREVRRFWGHTGWVTPVCFSPDGRYVLSGSGDKTIRLWEVESGKELRRFEGHTGPVTSVCFSPDGRYVLSGSGDKTIRLWELDWEWEF